MASLSCPRLQWLLLVVLATRSSAFAVPPCRYSNKVVERKECTVHYFWRGLDKTEEADDEATQSRSTRMDDEIKGKRKRDRLKTDFDRLFLGTPSMQDILSGQTSTNIPKNDNTMNRQATDEAWLEEEKKQIESYYQKIFDQMLAELADQRIHDPSAVPSNAEEMLRGVLMEEMRMEIDAKRKAMQVIDDPENEVVTDLASKRRRVVRKKSGNSRVQEYKQYEFDAVPQAGPSDQWSLDKLQKELQARLEEEEEKAANQPETMKEWQMLRSITSRAGILKEAEEEISGQFQSWKEYVAKEEAMRKEAGLARGPKLPFAWQEVERDQARKESEIQAAIQRQGRTKSNEEIRDEVNEKSIAALEHLIRTTPDPGRSARLQNTLLTLKQELEACRLDDPGNNCEEEYEEAVQSELSAEIDINEALRARTVSISPSDLSFTDGYEDDDDDKEKESLPKPTIPKPNTAFFADDDDDDDLDGTSEAASTAKRGEGRLGYSLGTIEEQKLRAQFQRAGAKTTEEKEAFRAQWEDFQRYEQSMRDESGLSDNADDDESTNTDDDDSRINMDAYATEDGDFDAAKILASIGPRPTRRRKRKREDSIDGDGPAEDGTGGRIDDDQA